MSPRTRRSLTIVGFIALFLAVSVLAYVLSGGDRLEDRIEQQR